MTGRRRAAGRPVAAVLRAQRRWRLHDQRVAAATSGAEVFCAAQAQLRAVAAASPGRVADEHLRAAAAELVARVRRMEGVRDDRGA